MFKLYLTYLYMYIYLFIYLLLTAYLLSPPTLTSTCYLQAEIDRLQIWR